jgi:alkanesulfonate monooxygenase SsuD/methylene tetrahydromethanopterin reductase-like flavin-dependent oxidoreductase (luciferase family)
MKLALSIPHHGKLAGAEFVRDFCAATDELGFGALWALDHVVMPERINSAYTLARRPAVMKDNSVSRLLSPNYESTSTLLFAAGVTSRIALGTSVSVLPLRNPVLNARMLATLDIYSGGRLIYGVGVGWLRGPPRGTVRGAHRAPPPPLDGRGSTDLVRRSFLPIPRHRPRAASGPAATADPHRWPQ